MEGGTEMKPENPHLSCNFITTGVHPCAFAWQGGFEAATKFWGERCTEHKIKKPYPNPPPFVVAEFQPEHRYDCPWCRKENGLC